MATYIHEQLIAPNNAYKLVVTIEESPYSISGNYTPIKVTGVITGMSGTYSAYNTTSANTVNINGTVYRPTTAYNIGLNKSTQIFSYTQNIPHESDGSKTLAFSWSFSGALSQYNPNGTISKTQALTKIPRASSVALSATRLEYGQTLGVTMTRADSSFKHDITITLPNRSQSYTGVDLTQDFTIPLSWLDGFITGEEASGTVSVQTKQGSTNIGSPVSVAFKAVVPASVVPTVAVNLVKVDNSGAGGLSTYTKSIATISKLTYGQTHTLPYSATLKSVEWATHEFTSTGNECTFTPLLASQTLTCTLTDSRGRKAVQNFAVASVPYSAPTLSAYHERCLSDGTSDQEGEWVRFRPTYTISDIEGLNTPTVGYRINTDPIKEGNVTVASDNWTSALGDGLVFKTNAYFIVIRVTDKIGRSATTTLEIPVSEVLLNFPDSADSLAIGMFSNKGRTLQVAWDAEFYGTFSVKGEEVYSPSNKPTPEDIGAFPNTGGTIEGDVNVTGLLETTTLTTTGATSTGDTTVKSIRSLGNAQIDGNLGVNGDFTIYGSVQGDFPKYIPVFTGDANGVTHSCVVFAANATNTPTTYCTLMTLARGSTDTTQVAFGNGAQLWTRFRNAQSTWTAWTAK